MTGASAFVRQSAVALSDFAALCEQSAKAADYPGCAGVQNNVVIYHADTLHKALHDDPIPLMNQLHHLLRHGPGVLVVRQAYGDLQVVDRHSRVFEAILARQAQAATAAYGTPCKRRRCIHPSRLSSTTPTL